MSLLPARAMELHLRVPADHWCLTFNEFFQFVEDVRAAWLVGEILQSETWHTFVGAKGNELTCVGPNMSRRSRMCLFSIQCSLSCKGCAMFGQNHVERETEISPRRAFSKSEESNPDPLHECSRHGPNLYQVNEYSGSAQARWALSRFKHVQGSFPSSFWMFFRFDYLAGGFRYSSFSYAF